MADEYVNMDQETHEMGKNVKHTDYIYDLGEYPVKHGNLQRFRDTYASNRPEYCGHAFKAEIDGKMHTLRVPRNVAREIHLLAESKAHPITFHQKLQPNYVKGNSSHPNKVGKTTVETCVYFNGIQCGMKIPIYLKEKGWAMQSAMFASGTKMKRLNDDDYTTVKDLDYSADVAKKMFGHAKASKKNKNKDKKRYGKDMCAVRSMIEDKDTAGIMPNDIIDILPDLSDLHEEAEGEEVHEVEDDSELDGDAENENMDDYNAGRTAQSKIARKKQTKSKRLKTQNLSRRGAVTRSMEKAQARGEGAGAGRGRGKAQKRKLEYDEDDSIDGDGNNRKSVSAQGSGSGKSGEFDLFNLNEPKKDWDEHPEMPKMMELGRKKIEMVGFSSPKAGMGEITMKRLAKARNLKLPSKKAEAVDVLVRALAIEKLQQDDPNTSKFYEDKKSGGSSTD